MSLICEQCGASTEGRADSVSLWGMCDDHTFRPYTAATVDELIAAWREDLKTDNSISLCPIIVKSGRKELRQVGKMLHPDYQRGVPKNEAAVIVFREAALTDPDISRLMAESVSPRRPAMADFKPITEWTRAELVAAAQERGTGIDPIFDEMLRRLEAAEDDDVVPCTFGDSEPADYKPAHVTPGGNIVAPQCCGQSMADVGGCANGCCDDYHCSTCGHKVRVEWPD